MSSMNPEKSAQTQAKTQGQESWDVIVIGSGLGGMTAATLLAMARKKVLLLERHYVPGGFTHTFKRKGYEWDVGVHYVGQVGKENSILKKIFDYVSDGKIKWASIGFVYDQVFLGDKKLDYVAGREEQIQNLLKSFPQEENAIRQYMKTVHSAAASSAWFFGEKTMPFWMSQTVGWLLRRRFEKWAKQTTYEVLRKITSNPDLIAAFCAQCGDYGLPPQQSSFGVHAMVVDHYVDGASYPIGGAKAIYEGILTVFRKHGGTLRLKSEVSTILIENEKAVGVHLSDGQKLLAPVIISNAGFHNTFGKLLAEKFKSKCLKPTGKIPEVAASTAHVCLYVGLSASDETLDLPKNNIWIYDDSDFVTMTAAQAKQIANQRKLTYISFPSAKDPDWKMKNTNRSTVQVIRACSFEQVSQWQNLPFGQRGSDYDQLKRQWSGELLEKLFRVLPRLKDHIAYTEISTPLSTRHFMNYESGEIYGLEHTPERFAMKELRPQTRIPGLFLTGQDVVTVGVGGALYSGVLAATKVLNKSVILRILLKRSL